MFSIRRPLFYKGKEKLAHSLPRIAAVSGDNDEDEANHLHLQR